MAELTVPRGDLRRFHHDVWQPRVSKRDPLLPYHLGGSTLRFTAKLDADDPTPVIAKTTGTGIEHLAEPSNRAVTTIDPADTNALAAPLVLVWDLQLTTPLGETVTVDSGTLLVEADITR